jgi:hypothetical protein
MIVYKFLQIMLLNKNLKSVKKDYQIICNNKNILIIKLKRLASKSILFTRILFNNF